MKTRRLGKTGRQVSEIGFGAWGIGADWGSVDDRESLAAMHAAVDAGMTFFDTADVYGDGRSERLVGQLLRERPEQLVVATKFGRRVPLDPAAYTYDNFRTWIERSRENLGVETVDLVQLHCLPWETYYTPSVFEACDRLVEEGLVQAYGVSVEKVEEALKAIEYPGVVTVQIIFNAFRQRPAGLFLRQAAEHDVGVIARVPLASGLLTGKFDRASRFAADDHRAYNRHGESFDVGETFSGVDFEAGLEAVEELRPLVPPGAMLAQLALRWILDFEAVSTVIPGAKTPEQARANAEAAGLPPLSEETHAVIADVYRRRIAPAVHQRW
ncbi:MAG TPA: aldo/keto reductase [Gaiellaceae bacterium]|nr:aldo/keto reductase [Gaiellaceae bacterium]